LQSLCLRRVRTLKTIEEIEENIRLYEEKLKDYMYFAQMFEFDEPNNAMKNL
jgi:hypothetical protein